MTAACAEQYCKVLQLLSRKLMEDEAALGVNFPYVTAANGKWEGMPASLSAGYRGADWSHGNWFCGFWIGLHLAAYLQTGNEKHWEIAEERLRLIAIRAEDENTHDIGFIFSSSAVIAHHITGHAAYRDLALKAASLLRQRTIVTDKGAYISAWGPLDDPRGRRSSAIDTMGNLPLLYWAAAAGSDESYLLAGEAHAEMTRTSFLRADLSTFHAVEYDLPQGSSRGFTFQGYADDSCWSRGQAWAIYGYVATAAATGKRGYLDVASQLADYWFRRLNGEFVPFWDFDDPAIPEAPRDSAAAAIVASALLGLAALHPDPALQVKWRAQAEATLDALCRDYVAWEPGHRGLLKHGCYSKPHGIGIDSAVLFGDFYFAEALCSAVMPGRLKPAPSKLRQLEE